MDKDYYLDLSKYCLNCIKKPCSKGCPLENDIPGFIKLVKEENYLDAFKLLSETTVLSGLCGRICPHSSQCQGSCIRGIKGKPVSIGELEAYVFDLAIENNWSYNKKRRIGKRVAVVGGGPSGLTCAAFLRRNGIDVTIYERYDYLGGLLVHGIPDFRLPKDIVKSTISKILDLGIDVKYNMSLGDNLSLEELKNDYDAVFIGIGANLSKSMNIPGENLLGVYGGNELLEHGIKLDYNNKTIIVSGGGNVAMDVARYIKHEGNNRVIVVYRRSEEEMPAEAKEIEDAKREGVEFLFQTTINKVLGERFVTGIEVLKNELVDKGEGRLSPVPIEGSNYNILCDYVMMAVGSRPDHSLREINLEKNREKIKIDASGRTSDEKVFSGGDIAGVKGTVAAAARSGRDAAMSIIEYLKK